MNQEISEVRAGQVYQDIDGERRGRVTGRFVIVIERENCDGPAKWVVKNQSTLRFTNIAESRLLKASRFNLVVDPSKMPVPAQLAGY